MSAVAAKLSIATPVVTMLPGVSADWEKHASVEDLALIAEAADRLGYHHLTCSEHIALPKAEKRRRGTRYRDPLATLGYLAARARRIRLATNVLVLGYHHRLEIAKRYGTTWRTCRRSPKWQPREPLATTIALAPTVEERWRSAAVRPVFAGPMRTMVSWEAWR